MSGFLPYGRQSVDEGDVRAVSEVLRADWLTQGPRVEAFEKAVAARVGARYAVACASGTAALHLAMLAAGIGPGETVATVPITFVASANCARYVGAEVAFVDVEPECVTMDPVALDRLLSSPARPPVRAIVPVHFAGHPARMPELWDIARVHNLIVVEDACHALGASYTGPDGVPVRVGTCAHSHMAVFSFHPVKHITTGEGGAVTTNSRELFERLLTLRNHGIVREGFEDRTGAELPWYYEMQALGFNYRLTDVQCALGLSQLPKLDGFLKRRREIAAQYRTALRLVFSDEQVLPLAERPGVQHAYHLFPVQIDFGGRAPDRATVMRRLRERGVGSQVHYIPLYRQPYYRRITASAPEAFPNSEHYYARALSLPIYPALPVDGVERVVGALETALEA